MTPPVRRGGGGTRGRGRGRGARASAPAAAATATEPTAAPTADNARGGARGSEREAKSRSDKSRGARKSGARGGAQSAARPARSASRAVRKVVVRNLPASFGEAQIAQLVEAHGASAALLWRVVPGRIRGNNRAPLAARAYLDFKKDADAAKAFVEHLDGTALPGEKGRDASIVRAEMAPFQKTPREKMRKDPKAGTIDRDPEYLAFLEELNKPKEKLPSADVVADAKDSEVAEKPVAALVTYLNTRRRSDKTKKGKLTARTAEKTRGTRSKSSKDVTKTSREKAKGGKCKDKSAGEPPAETQRNRKPRVKSNGSKAASATEQPVTDGVPEAVPKVARRVSDGPEDASNAKEKKNGGASNKAGGKTPRRSKSGTANDGASVKETKPRTRREPRGPKTAKSGVDGRDEQRKLFAPKIRPQAG